MLNLKFRTNVPPGKFVLFELNPLNERLFPMNTVHSYKKQIPTQQFTETISSFPKTTLKTELKNKQKSVSVTTKRSMYSEHK